MRSVAFPCLVVSQTFFFFGESFILCTDFFFFFFVVDALESEQEMDPNVI